MVELASGDAPHPASTTTPASRQALADTGFNMEVLLKRGSRQWLKHGRTATVDTPPSVAFLSARVYRPFSEQAEAAAIVTHLPDPFSRVGGLLASSLSGHRQGVGSMRSGMHLHESGQEGKRSPGEGSKPPDPNAPSRPSRAFGGRSLALTNV